MKPFAQGRKPKNFGPPKTKGILKKPRQGAFGKPEEGKKSLSVSFEGDRKEKKQQFTKHGSQKKAGRDSSYGSLSESKSESPGKKPHVVKQEQAQQKKPHIVKEEQAPKKKQNSVKQEQVSEKKPHIVKQEQSFEEKPNSVFKKQSPKEKLSVDQEQKEPKGKKKRPLEEESVSFQPEKKVPRLEKQEPQPINVQETKKQLKKKKWQLKKQEQSRSISIFAQGTTDGRNAIIAEENRRRQTRDERSLFLKGMSRKMNATDLKGLHEGIVSVRIFGAHCWIMFPSKAVCQAAYPIICKQSFKEQPIEIDFCGTNSKSNRETSGTDKYYAPIDYLQLIIGGISKSSKEELKIFFPKAINVNIVMKQRSDQGSAYVKFDNVEDARAAFDKGASLTIANVPVVVYYARILNKNDKPPKSDSVIPKLVEKKAVDPVKDESGTSQESESGDSEIDSSEEGIEEGSEVVSKNKDRGSDSSDTLGDEDSDENDDDEEDGGSSLGSFVDSEGSEDEEDD